MRKTELEALLTTKLGLKAPVFRLQKVGTKWSGLMISDTFKGKADNVRQKMIWDALDAQLGPESVHQVGMLLAYTPEEWNVDLPAKAG